MTSHSRRGLCVSRRGDERRPRVLFCFGRTSFNLLETLSVPCHPNDRFGCRLQYMQCFVAFIVRGTGCPANAPYVCYTDERGQLLDTLPVCQDFNRHGCNRRTCRFVHIREGCGLQVVSSRVVVCRDAAAGACRRASCRYYHIPVTLPPALRPP
ncbi:unnamed protein product [Plutella xylostella]|uniref:(diamondback moth) hypothetical protein n=1 Tax=Plutella xylostella TaxID=51655 RepID=A0A8S4DMM9_PLUXY|nr:unnamed protein product [Plutella xylostella]